VSTRNPEFYIKGADGQSLPYMERNEVYRIEDPNLEISAFRTGDIDIIGTVGQTTDLLKQTVRDLYVLDAKLLNQTGDRLWIDATVPPYTDQRVRQALAKLFNRDQILAQVYFGSGWLNPMMFVPNLDWVLPQSEFDSLVGYNPQQAQQLLQAAGVDPGSLSPNIPNGVAYQRNVGTSESYLAELAKIGIRGQLRPIESQEVIEIFRSAKEPIAIMNDPAPRGTNLHLFNWFHSSGGVATYWKKLADAEFDRLIEAQATILDPEERKVALQNTIRRGLTDAVASPTVGQTGEVAIQPHLAGYLNDTQEPYRLAFAWTKA
jgi:ABC-type transport system substrate-binding protein